MSVFDKHICLDEHAGNQMHCTQTKRYCKIRDRIGDRVECHGKLRKIGYAEHVRGERRRKVAEVAAEQYAADHGRYAADREHLDKLVHRASRLCMKRL